ncbi:Transcriptional regulatory protein ZraR [Gemmata obscuriglobus]|uniref:Sigma-54-dependent Fis family transcriptional regulator n=1 Tax=Gemmata obscuriglobus TaxID=114 RepID=A0A2Z3H3F0_9BACT|nr:sigma-54-dependent Fis family transcriptional regulator [Gemmata obscuriglobus]AWM38106.1 sigma-54-dependent Fis family transcriptional regulator [Gemmata obscuriglobus]QEG29014.1 Transcriptional regulatory protein ZraR [Gemmata obscuriglobus]VTS07603.1 fis family transcriptional regulator : Transcriptional regulator, NifA subfamily, Fis Family OS=Pirellula staleyi (strain ATCC 27377 / DSM 6068 / ICPB 4128) GN=Psta_3595 PE=4 SV=1: FHA: GAF: Sigma54_activat: HTH_8 [Gemmata obscuriglobus UQM 22
MAQPPDAFLVARRDDGFGDVFPLHEGTRYKLGRAPTNRVVLRDDLCSREHAEVFAAEGGWFVRDLGSLNGTHLNGELLRSDRPLRPQDELRLGRTRFVFVDEMSQLPDPPQVAPAPAEHVDGLEIRKRLGQTRYQQQPSTTPDAEATLPAARVPPPQAVGVLYRLALDMAAAADKPALCVLAADAVFRATPAEVVAVLALKEGRELELVTHRVRNGGPATYHKVSQFVSSEVLSDRQAILAENVATDRMLKDRDSIAELKVASLICAPIMADDKVLGLLHLYRTIGHAPLNADDLEFTLAVARHLGTVWHRFSRQASLSAENRSLRSQLKIESEIVGESAVLQQIESQVVRVAETRATVLVRGESGSGKELVARAIHLHSPRREGAFICLNCAALTETLLESELFGHEKGAFTGATERMVGKFEAADNGTIFLDEIGEMALSTQAKFLRVLEGHPFERVGGNTAIKVDVRVVAATNRPLEEAVRAGTFRRDLFYRLQVVQLDVPPLRDRLDDVPLLAEHFLKRFARETARKFKGFTPEALDKLRAYRWPGNVRELRNVIERAVALGNGPQLDAADIWLSGLDVGAPVVSAALVYKPETIEEVEKRHILETLKHTDWNKSRAATILGIERSTLDRKIDRYGLTK